MQWRRRQRRRAAALQEGECGGGVRPWSAAGGIGGCRAGLHIGDFCSWFEVVVQGVFRADTIGTPQ